MRTKVWLILVMLVVFSGNSFARNMTWLDLNPADHSWGTIDNWWDNDSGAPATVGPGSGDNVFLNANVTNPIIDSSVTSVVANMYGPEEKPYTVKVDMTGGSLQVINRLNIGANDTSGGGGIPGTFNLSGGTLSVDGETHIGEGVLSNGVMNVSGGIANLNNVRLGWTSGCSGTINITDGIVDARGTMFWLGTDGVGIVNMSGGTLQGVGGPCIFAHNSGGYGEFNLSDGDVNLGSEIWLAHGGTGRLNMTGGTFNTPSGIRLSNAATGNGHLQLDGGTINLGWLDFTAGTGLIDITQGTLNITNNWSGNIANMVAAGQITGYGGNGEVVIEFDAGTNITTVTAIPEPATLIIMGAGSALAFIRRRKK